MKFLGKFGDRINTYFFQVCSLKFRFLKNSDINWIYEIRTNICHNHNEFLSQVGGGWFVLCIFPKKVCPKVLWNRLCLQLTFFEMPCFVEKISYVFYFVYLVISYSDKNFKYLYLLKDNSPSQKKAVLLDNVQMIFLAWRFCSTFLSTVSEI